MKKLLLFIIITSFFFSCTGGWEEKGYMNYSDYTQKEFSKLKSPVILIGIHKSWNKYSITIKDSAGTVHYYGNLSGLANTISASRQIGDTLK